MADTNGSDAQVLGTIATDGPKSYASSKMVDGQLIQLIKEDQNFNQHIAEVMADPWKMSKLGFDYNILAVFGSQSTGKSTLLNRLFATRFDVMSDAERRQTTKGIWCAKDPERPLLIMDVEGADGRERGEQQDFERKTALFCISVAEVVIVNMWEHQVGLYQGANMGLLKTVFEVNLQLFQQRGSPKTLLFFVIRDYIGVTPFANLRRTLEEDLKKLWDTINKPKGLENTRITDFFDLDFTPLAHKYNKPEDFEEDCKKLALRFRSKEDSGYLFQPEYHKHIPADGFPKYAEDVWATIVSNRDLDLPTQQELLAQFRCDEIMSQVWSEDFVAGIKSVQEAVEKGQVVSELGKQIGGLRAGCLDKFDEDAQRYQREVYDKKRAEFEGKMNSVLKSIHQSQLKNLQRSCVAQFKASLEQKLAPSAVGGKTGTIDFASQLKAVQREIMDQFIKVAGDSVLEGTDWSHDEMVRELEDDLSELGNKVRQEELKRAIDLQEKTVQVNVSDHVAALMSRADPNMWDQIWKVFRDTLGACGEKLIERAEQLDLGSEETLAAETKLKRTSWEGLRRKIGDEMSDINMLARCRNRFDQEFRYDEKGVPRVWKPEDDMDEAYQRAKDSVARILPLSRKIGIDVSAINDLVGADENVDEASLTLMSEAKFDDLSSRVMRDMDITFTEAKRSVINSTSRVPPWMIMLMMFLGWNEAMALLSNPFLVFLLVLGGITFWVLTATGTWGPAKAIVLQTSRQLGSQISQTLDGSGINVDGVVKRAKTLTSAAVDAGSSLLDSHKAAGSNEHEMRETAGSSSNSERTPPPNNSSLRSDLRYRGPQTPGAFASPDHHFDTPTRPAGRT